MASNETDTSNHQRIEEKSMVKIMMNAIIENDGGMKKFDAECKDHLVRDAETLFQH